MGGGGTGLVNGAKHVKLEFKASQDQNTLQVKRTALSQDLACLRKMQLFSGSKIGQKLGWQRKQFHNFLPCNVRISSFTLLVTFSA